MMISSSNTMARDTGALAAAVLPRTFMFTFMMTHYADEMKPERPYIVQNT
jgi:hypothetical protein